MAQTENDKLYLAQIHQLKELQKVDDRIHELNRQKVEKPRELEDLQKKFEETTRRRDAINDKISHLRTQESRLARETEEENERLRKSKDKLMSTGNEREYNAVTREIDSIERMSQPREDERVTVLDELKNQNALLEEVEVEYADLKARVDSRLDGMKAELAEIEKSLADLEKERAACSAGIPTPIFQRYEFIRERLDHPVIVSLSDGVCPSCHIAVPPQTYNDLLRGGQILSCPNCQRLIVWRNHYYADQPELLAEMEARDDLEARNGGRKPSMGRSVALEREFKEEKDDVDFASAGEDSEEELHIDTISSDLNSMSRMADVSDLADMSEMTGLSDIGANDETDENDPSK